MYPHDDPSGHVLQEYRPGDVAGRRYYDPSDHGAEAVVKERMRGWGRGSDEEVDR